MKTRCNIEEILKKPNIEPIFFSGIKDYWAFQGSLETLNVVFMNFINPLFLVK
jgi:hypothetical protein